jgi:hypothetical protein
MSEVEVFRMSPSDFDKSKCYAFALYTRTTGYWPNQKYYSRNPLRYVGYYTRSYYWGHGDAGGGTEYFNDNGNEIKINLDYEGTTCFREVPCNPAQIPSLQYLSYNNITPEEKMYLRDTTDILPPKPPNAGGNAIKRNKKSGRKLKRKLRRKSRKTRRYKR